MAEGGTAEDVSQLPFGSYEEYLDSQLEAQGLSCVKEENKELARQLVEQGILGENVLQREAFEARQAAAAAAAAAAVKQLASVGKELKDAFMLALAEREEGNLSGRISSILYIRDYNSRGQEISAYIDYAHRLTTDDFEAYFSGKKKLLPRKTDLSFYNWNKNFISSSPSPNYEVIAEDSCGVHFKNKRDGKIINVNPKLNPGDNTTRTDIKSDLYVHVAIYDHIVDRRT